MKRLAFTIDEETLSALKELAAAEKESVSHYLRRLIRKEHYKKALDVRLETATPLHIQLGQLSRKQEQS